MNEDQYNNLFYFLHENKINFKFKKYIREEYIPFDDPNEYIIEFTTIEILNSISIDIFVHKKNVNIYDVMDTILGTNIDFYCNCLRYYNKHISINKLLVDKYMGNNKKYLYEYDFKLSNIDIIISYYYDINRTFEEEYNNIIVLNDIIGQIKKKIALIINEPDKHRIEKMISKNWLIIN
jgi:hypothetical protein